MATFIMSTKNKVIKDEYLPKMLRGELTPKEVSKLTGLKWDCVRMWLYRERMKIKKQKIQLLHLSATQATANTSSLHNQSTVIALGEAGQSVASAQELREIYNKLQRLMAEFTEVVNKAESLSADLKITNQAVNHTQQPDNIKSLNYKNDIRHNSGAVATKLIKKQHASKSIPTAVKNKVDGNKDLIDFQNLIRGRRKAITR